MFYSIMSFIFDKISLIYENSLDEPWNMPILNDSKLTSYLSKETSIFLAIS